MDLWEQYAEVRSDELKNDGDGSKSREFYINHRDAMDDGAELSWPENFRKGYVSAIQDAMDRRFRSYNAFMAEYQCDPLEDTEGRGFSMTAADIVSKINGYRAGVVPSQAEILTGFIDVHGEVLFYCIIAWKPDFTGWIVEYGTFPKQNRKYFALADANPIMSKYLATEYIELRGQATEPIVAKGLSLLLADLTEREWKKDDGNSITLSRLLIDTGWKDEIVYGCIRMLNQKPVSLPIVMGSKGKGITATKKPFSSYTKHPGDIVGSRWRSPKPEKGRQRIVHIDTNYYKSFVHSRLFVPLQASGSISLFGEDPRKADHTLISEHLTAEIPKEVFSKTDNQTVVEWQKKPNADNHWLDCVVGCCAAASSCGCALPEAMSETPKVSRKEAEQEFMASLKRRGVV
jgi:phage terminase large subunit GpA-like protein